MKFDDYRMFSNLYHDMATDGSNHDFEEVTLAIMAFERHLENVESALTPRAVNDLRSFALAIGNAMEIQGFLIGISYGMKMQKQADNLCESIERD